VKEKNLLKVELAFVLTGALVGTLFVWLISIPTAVDFWFVRGNQFLIPRVKYWLLFGVLLASGLALSYYICILRVWLMSFGHWLESRRILAILILLLAFPSGYITGSHFFEFVDPILASLLGSLISVSLVSVAVWLFTLTWKPWLAILVLFAIPVSYFLTIGVYKSLDLSNLAYDVLRMSSLSGLLSGISGYWLATTQTYSASVRAT